jgi:lysozyme
MSIYPKVVDIYQFDAGEPGDDRADFAKAHAWGIRGAIHKVGEGAGITDRLYASRRPKALAAGMLWGGYYFLRPGDQVAMAKRFVALMKPDSKTLVAIDHEDSNVSLAAMLQFYMALKAELAALGLKPKVKLYSGFLIKAQVPHATLEQIELLLEMDLWGCQYNTSWIHVDVNHKPLPWSDIWLWQYTGDGSGPLPHDVPGLQSRMDVNSWGGTDDQLAAEWA